MPSVTAVGKPPCASALPAPFFLEACFRFATPSCLGLDGSELLERCTGCCILFDLDLQYRPGGRDNAAIHAEEIEMAEGGLVGNLGHPRLLVAMEGI